MTRYRGSRAHRALVEDDALSRSRAARRDTRPYAPHAVTEIDRGQTPTVRAGSDPCLTNRSMPRTRRLHAPRRLRVEPLEVLDVLPHFRIAEVLIRHRHVVELLQHRLRVRIGLQHLLGRFQPAREP